MIGESFGIALGALASNKLRSILTMLGIIIGVGAVIALLAAGQGVDLLIRTQIQSIGSNLVFVMPRSGGGGMPGSNIASGQTLTLGDSTAIGDPLNVPEVVAVAPDLTSFGKVVYSNKNTTTSIDGVTPAFSEVRNFGVAYGSFITDQDLALGARVAVLGQSVVDALFGNEIYPIDQRIKINNVAFRVIGVLEQKGGTGFGDQDDIVLIPLTTAVTRVFKSKSIRGDYPVTVIYAQVASEDQIDAAISNITELLRQRHNITYRDDDDFNVINQADILNIFGQITGVVTIFLGAIAAISLLVGGIGIMNIMLVSVTERTREIGIRKAVGAKRRDILMQFLVEATVLSLMGGMVGVGLGVAGAKAIQHFAPDLTPVVTINSVLLATGFAAAVGLFFGIYPATRAASLNPIEALRYE